MINKFSMQNRMIDQFFKNYKCSSLQRKCKVKNFRCLIEKTEINLSQMEKL